MKKAITIGIALIVGVTAWVAWRDTDPSRPVSYADFTVSPVEHQSSAVLSPEVEPVAIERVPSPVAQHAVADAAPAPLTDDVGSDPCAEISTENKALAFEVKQLRAEVARLRLYGGRDPYQHFLQSADAEVITAPEARKIIRGFLQIFPFYLQPGEAIWLLENQDETGGYDSIEGNILRFLGPERVLREAPPEWLAGASDYYDEEEWQAIFGQPLPSK